MATTILIEAAISLGSALSVGLAAIGSGSGEGLAAGRACQAIKHSPKQQESIFKTMLVGMALAESTAIFGLVIAMILLFSVIPGGNPTDIFIMLSAGICMGLGAIGSGMGAAMPTGAACIGIARQPKMSGKLTTNMLISSAVCQTPAIFAMVVSLLMIFTKTEGIAVNPAWGAYVGAGFATGLAAISAGTGCGFIAEACCEGAARNPHASDNLLKTTLLGQAVNQTTVIYGLLISLILLFLSFDPATGPAKAAALLGAGLAMGIGGIGPGIGEGFAASRAIKGMARNTKCIGEVTRIMLVAMAVVESCAIYALVIALILIFIA